VISVGVLGRGEYVDGNGSDNTLTDSSSHGAAVSNFNMGNPLVNRQADTL